MKTVRDACQLQPNDLSIKLSVSGRIKLTHLGSLQTDPPLAAVF